MSAIPLHWLLLLLSSLTGVQPPPDVPRGMMVAVRPLPAPYSGYNCGDGVGALDPICPASIGIRAGDVVLDDALWAHPYTMQHLAMHELGHTVCSNKGGNSEQCAEAYACQWVPMSITVSGVECRRDGTVR